MYSILAVFIGCIISTMVAVNGELSAAYGIFGAAVVIHVAGVAFGALVLLVLRRKLHLTKSIPLWMYLGGVIGVLTTLFNNFACGKISMTSIVALGLFGQTLISLLTDWLGLFGLEKCPFRMYKLVCLLFAAVGMVTMLDGTEQAAAVAVAVSLLAGVTVVLSRVVNANLSARIGYLQGAFVNHFAGLLVTVAVLLLFGRSEPIFSGLDAGLPAWAYTGGALGFFVVMLFNVAVPRIPAVNLTMLTFVGQVFTGVLIDLITKSGYSPKTFFGGLLVAAGIFLDILITYILKRKSGRDVPQPDQRDA